MVITDRAQTHGRPLVSVVESALEGGARLVQLREKDLEGGALLALTRELRALTKKFAAELWINDRLDVALAAAADGVVLPGNSFASADARRLLGSDRGVGRSTHSAAEVERAAAEGLDLALFGPVHATPSKAAQGPPQGLEALQRAARASIPLYAVGGIDAANAAAAIDAGAWGVAVIREIMAAADPAAATRALLAALSGRGR